MDRPVPAPREVKKPVPTPRRFVNKSNENVVASSAAPEPKTSPDDAKNTGKLAEEHFNTFSRRVKSASQQIAGDLNQLVQDRKKAVIEGTRQSVRRIRRRFSSASQETQYSHQDKPQPDFESTFDIFSNIKFDSPIHRSDSIYNNIEDDSDSDSSISLPPPTHPPPPLPDESVYDAPLSLSSGSNSGQSNRVVRKSGDYESVFPLCLSKSDSDSSVEVSGRTLETGVDLTRSDSWAYYDSAQENIYDNINPVPEKTDPAKPPRKHKVDLNSNLSSSSGSSESKTNSIYENHDIVFRQVDAASSSETRVSQSVLLQFDPLTEASDSDSVTSNLPDIKLLEELLQGDLYGNISDAHTIDNWSTSNESETEEFVNPPTPPLRVDSLPEEEHGEAAAQETSPKSRTNWFTDPNPTDQKSPEPKKNWFKQVKEVVEKAPDVFKSSKKSDFTVERPILGGKTFVQKRGMLYKVQSGPVEDLFGEYSGRWCVMENSCFICYSDNTCTHAKEYFPAQNILSVQLLQDPKYKYRYDNDDLHCFELNIAGKTRGGHIYGSRNSSERRIWMQVIVESLTQRFKSRLTTNFTRMGWAYIREGVSGKWVGAWILLSERELHYAVDRHSVKTMDLRKARCIVLQSYQDIDDNPKTNDKGPNMLIDCPDVTLYLRMWTARETKVWCHIVKLDAQNNGANLDQQQLTRNDIPVIVEKCINFIYAHGSMSEGIYRKSGQGSLVADLLTKFRKDAFAVQLTKNNCNEFEVATALKRFFRDLPEPLFGCDHRQYLHEVAKHNDKDEKIRMFKAALEQLPTVSYKTARKLLGHLRFISNQSDKNRMTVENLASIWGPTLMHYEDKDRPKNSSNSHIQDTEVVCQLIRYYRHVFPEDPGELEKENIMLRVLEKHAQSPQGAVNRKTAGDFRVWIFLFNKEGKSYNVAIGPNKTAYEVCLELSDKIKSPVHELVLEEVVLSDRLVRPIHHTEKVLNIVLKWSYWDENDRKDNYLVLSPLSKYWEYLIEKPLPVSGELKFADTKTKVFRMLTFQFSQGSLTCFKDKTGEVILASWRIEDIVWYLGHESKRSPQSRWTVTFLQVDSKPTRSKNSPYFGNVLVWGDAATRANWLSAMLKARYPNNLAPPPKLLAI